jgi:hypothetical protein
VRKPAQYAVLAAALLAPGASALADRPAGHVFTWGYELNQDELPTWNPDGEGVVVPARRWYRTINQTLARSGAAGLWFTGPSALPFPPLPLSPREPIKWRAAATLSRQYRVTGLSWDVSYEVWPARNLVRTKTAVAVDPRTDVHARRISLLDPAYRRESLKEIRRIVPTVRTKPYVFAYQGADEPFIPLPYGPKAERSAYAKTMRAQVRAYGAEAPKAKARKTDDPREGLRWLAYSRWSGDRLFALKAAQAAAIRRLDSDAKIIPADFGFIDGFTPWDYSRLGEFGDIAEADPYVSLAEAENPGRGRYNPGFTAKFLSDLSGKRTRIVLQAFKYASYTPETADLYTWAAQALRAGATDISLFASDNPRFTDPDRYTGLLALSQSLKGATLPDPPVDPTNLVVYATASEGQGQPNRIGGARYRTSGDALYSTYSLLGELAHGAFSFDADTRLVREPARLAAARTIWLPRADTLDRPFADALVAWVKQGGTLIVTDPDAFTRTPTGASLADVRDALVGAPFGPLRPSSLIRVELASLGAALPNEELYAPIDAGTARAFTTVPVGATVVARYLDEAPAVIARPVGKGRVLAAGADLMRPEAVEAPLDTVRLVAALQTWSGDALNHPAWNYRIPGDPEPDRPPWEGSEPPLG